MGYRKKHVLSITVYNYNLIAWQTHLTKDKNSFVECVFRIGFCKAKQPADICPQTAKPTCYAGDKEKL